MSGAHRRIALFPGGFKPPHRAHLRAIEYLESRGDLDQVVVIVSNRARLVPGTSKALGAEVCAKLLRQLLDWRPRKLTDIRVVVARHRAIEHALEYINNTHAGDRLFFCVGEEDHRHGDSEFLIFRLSAL